MAPKHPRQPVDLSDLYRAVFVALDLDQPVELTCRLHRMAVERAERLDQN